MQTEKLVKRLKSHNLRKTPVRQRVLSVFMESQGVALSNSDIEDTVENLDRITLYRTLKTFEERGIIHQAIDGTGITKYALCSEMCTEHHHRDVHAHFFCTSCNRTTCLEDIPVPEPKLNEGFRISSAQLVLNGMCDDCSGNLR